MTGGNRQEHYRQRYSQLKPGWRHSLHIFRDVVDRGLLAGMRVLDIGCGHADFLAPVYARTSYTVGLDPDHYALDRNTIIRHRLVGLADDLPFADASFDLVIAVWLLEHLAQPEQTFYEIHRVIKPGGKTIFLTPNAWNYNTWIIRFTPQWLHGWLNRKLHGRMEHDTYPIRYRFNTVGKIDRTLTAIGFRQTNVTYHGDPTYISLNEILFRLACLIESALDTPMLQHARVHLIGVYEKLP